MLNVPIAICQCGCNEPIPPKPYHKHIVPKYNPEHFKRIRNKLLSEVKAKLRTKPPDHWDPPTGVCECGCGQPTPIATMTRTERGQYVGYPLRFLTGHNTRGLRAEQTSHWKGGRWKHKTGYIYVYEPSHPYANRDHYVLEHRLIYERAHGVLLKPTDIIHHINGIRDDNRVENLVRTTRVSHSRAHDKLGAFRERYPEEAQRHRIIAGKKGAERRWSKR